MAVKEGHIKDVADFYENLHKNSDLASVQWTGLSNTAFHTALKEANLRLLCSFYDTLWRQTGMAAIKLYETENISFRGFRTI